MSDTSEKKWKRTLIKILSELDNKQYRQTMEDLEKIPKSQKKGRKAEATMAQRIIEYYGYEESISEINDIMEEIPRKDLKMQDLLRPFVEELRNKKEKGRKGEKRECDPVEKEENPPAGKKRKCDPVEEKKTAAEDQEKSSQPVKETNTDSWKKSIRDLKSSSVLPDTDVIVGKVVQKSGVRTYQTKENVKRFFFYVAVADETASIKLMVYGKPLYKQIMEEKTYLFRQLRKDENSVVKFHSQSKYSETKSVQVPVELEMEARELIYPKSPDYSIADAKRSAHSHVTVKGTVTKIDPKEPATGKNKQKKKQRFQIRDDSDSISICMWGEDTKQCKGLSVGDVIQATNMRVNRYHDIIELNSTGYTKIQKVQSAGSQIERIKIEGITKATKKETHLDAFFRDEMHRCVVASRLLAKAFDFKLDGDIKEKLLDIIPVSADAVIQGVKIKKLTAFTDT